MPLAPSSNSPEHMTFSTGDLDANTNRWHSNILPLHWILISENCPSPKESWKSCESLDSGDGQFSDIKIQCKGKIFECHRIILASRSPVLKVMCSGEFEEGANGMIKLDFQNPEVVQVWLLIGNENYSSRFMRSREKVVHKNVSQSEGLKHKFGISWLYMTCVVIFIS